MKKFVYLMPDGKFLQVSEVSSHDPRKTFEARSVNLEHATDFSNSFTLENLIFKDKDSENLAHSFAIKLPVDVKMTRTVRILA